LGTHPVAATSIPGSNGERKAESPPPSHGQVLDVYHARIYNKFSDPFGDHTIHCKSGCRKVADAFSVLKKRTGKGRPLPGSAYVPHLVDLPYPDLYIPEKGKVVIGPVRDLKRLYRPVQTLVTCGKTSYKLRDATSVVSLDNVNHRLTFKEHPIDDWVKAFNINCKAFGPVARNKDFRFYIKLVTFFGISKKDFRNALRIRELWLRGSKHFGKAIKSLNFAFCVDGRKFINKLPKKVARIRPVTASGAH